MVIIPGKNSAQMLAGKPQEVIVLQLFCQCFGFLEMDGGIYQVLSILLHYAKIVCRFHPAGLAPVFLIIIIGRPGQGIVCHIDIVLVQRHGLQQGIPRFCAIRPKILWLNLFQQGKRTVRMRCHQRFGPVHDNGTAVIATR